MKIILAQTKYRTADFVYNYNQILSVLERADADLVILPQVGLEDTSGKHMLIDEK